MYVVHSTSLPYEMLKLILLEIKLIVFCISALHSLRNEQPLNCKKKQLKNKAYTTLLRRATPLYT